MTSNALILLAARIIAAATTLVALALVARLRTPEDLGVVALGLTFGLALAIIPEAGMTALFIREVVRAPSRTPRLLGAMLVIRSATLPGVTVIVGVLALLLLGDAALVVLVVALGPGIQQVGELARATFVAHGRIPVASVHTIAENLAWLGVITAALYSGQSLLVAFLLADATLVGVEIIGFAVISVLLRLPIVLPARADVDGLLRQAAPFAGFGAIAVVALRSDTIFVGGLLAGGLATVGAYYAASRIAAAGEYVSEAVGRSVYPEMARHHPHRPDLVADLLREALDRVVPLGVLIAFGFALFGETIMVGVYGPAYSGYGMLLAGLGAVLPVRFIATLSGVGLTSIDAQWLRTVVLGMGVASSIVVYFILIPRIGVTGAIAGMFAAWTPIAVTHIVILNRRLGRLLTWPSIFRAFAFGAVAYVAGGLVMGSGIVGREFGAGIAFVTLALLGIPAVWAHARRRASTHLKRRGRGRE